MLEKKIAKLYLQKKAVLGNLLIDHFSWSILPSLGNKESEKNKINDFLIELFADYIHGSCFFDGDNKFYDVLSQKVLKEENESGEIESDYDPGDFYTPGMALYSHTDNCGRNALMEFSFPLKEFAMFLIEKLKSKFGLVIDLNKLLSDLKMFNKFNNPRILQDILHHLDQKRIKDEDVHEIIMAHWDPTTDIEGYAVGYSEWRIDWESVVLRKGKFSVLFTLEFCFPTSKWSDHSIF